MPERVATTVPPTYTLPTECFVFFVLLYSATHVVPDESIQMCYCTFYYTLRLCTTKYDAKSRRGGEEVTKVVGDGREEEKRN